MSYVVLARKYRPQSFRDLVGQEHVTRTLCNAITHDRVHHAYLFCGARGLGKTTAARLLAKCLVCAQGPTTQPCNECNECLAVTEGRSVDVTEIDGASNNRVDDVRSLREQVRYLPHSARRKIYIIDEVHMLTGSAFNALLKTLEEPPEHVTFIFATTEVHELPATILSRVSRFDFRRLTPTQLVEHLQTILAKEQVRYEELALFTIARAADGSVRDALTLLDKILAFASDRQQIQQAEVTQVLGIPSRLAVAQLAQTILDRNAEMCLHKFNELFAAGQDLHQLAIALLQYFRDLMVVKLCQSQSVLVDASPSEYQQLVEQAAHIERIALNQLFDRLAQIVDELARSRVPRLVFEMGLLDLVHCESLTAISELIARFDNIASSTHSTPSSPSSSSPPVSQSSQKITKTAATKTPYEAKQTASPEPQNQGKEQQSIIDNTPLEHPIRTKPSETIQQLWKIAQESGAISQALTFHDEPEPLPKENAVSVAAAEVCNPQHEENQSDELCGCPGANTSFSENKQIIWRDLPAFAAWEQLLSKIHDEDQALYAVLADFGFVDLTSEALSLMSPKHGFAYQQFVSNHDMRRGLEVAIQTYLGELIKINLMDGDPTPSKSPSLTMVLEQRRAQQLAQLQQEAQSHAEIQALIRNFAGTLQAVEPLVDSSI